MGRTLEAIKFYIWSNLTLYGVSIWWSFNIMVWLLYLGYNIFAFDNNAIKVSEMACNVNGGTGPNLKKIFSVDLPAT